MIKGSIMLAFAKSKEDVLGALQEDIYFKEGIWDWDRVQIHPVCLNIPRSCSTKVPLTSTSSSLFLDNLVRVPLSEASNVHLGYNDILFHTKGASRAYYKECK